MGLVKKYLSKIKLPDREAHNSRLFIDLCENIHIHYRELRIVFSLDEYFEFVNIVNRSTEDVRSYLAQNPDYKEGVYPTTVMVAGGRQRQGKLLQNSPNPNKSVYFANDFVIELQDESVVDEIHVHWRDYRFAMPREHFKIIAESFSSAKRELEKFEASNEYIRKPHRDRTMEDFQKEREKYASYETTIMGEVKLPIEKIHTRFDNSDKKFRPDEKVINILIGAYEDNERLPPIILSKERDKTHKIIDGNHRYFAAKQAKKKEINCIIVDLTFEQSELFRKAESFLKRFDKETDYRFNTSGFNTHYFTHRASRYYYNHFYRLLKPPKYKMFYRKIKRYFKNLLKKQK